MLSLVIQNVDNVL